MFDIIGSENVRQATKLGAVKSPKLNYSSQRAVAEYKRLSGVVDTTEQLRLDDQYTQKVQAMTQPSDVNNEKIGTLINLFV